MVTKKGCDCQLPKDSAGSLLCGDGSSKGHAHFKGLAGRLYKDPVYLNPPMTFVFLLLEYPELERTQRSHRVQLPALHRPTPNHRITEL